MKHLKKYALCCLLILLFGLGQRMFHEINHPPIITCETNAEQHLHEDFSHCELCDFCFLAVPADVHAPIQPLAPSSFTYHFSYPQEIFSLFTIQQGPPRAPPLFTFVS